MLNARATLRAHEVIPSVVAIHVRPFDPRWLLGKIDAPVDQHLARTNGLAGRNIELLDPDRAMPFVSRPPRGQAVVQNVSTSVRIEEQRRVDAFDSRQPDGIRPGTGGIAGHREKIAASVDGRVDDVEHAVVEGDRRSKDAARHAEAVEVELTRAVDDMPHLAPMHEVVAFQHRDAGKIGKRRVHQVEHAVHLRDARVRIEAGEYGVAVGTRRGRLVENSVVTGVLEPVEMRSRWRHCACRNGWRRRWGRNSRGRNSRGRSNRRGGHHHACHDTSESSKGLSHPMSIAEAPALC